MVLSQPPTISKSRAERKAEDCQPLMGSSPLLGWSPYVKCMVISSQDNRKVAAKSPFKIQRELVKILGAEPHGDTKQRSGDLMVELHGKEQERKLERVASFLDIPVTVRPHKSLNTSRGVIKHSDFQDCAEEEFVDEFPDVIAALRIHVRKGDVRIPTNTIVLTFDCPKPPTSLRAGYLTVPVRPYVPFPMRCFKCHKFGHGKDKCRRPNALCGRCSKEHADQHQCTAAAHCINCKGDHPAFSKQCPKFVEEQAILRYKAEHGGTFQQARAAVIVEQCPPAPMHRLLSSALSLRNQRSRRPVTKSQLLSRLRQTPRGTLRPRVPREQCPVLSTSQGPANLRKKGPLGNQSVVLAMCRTWTRKSRPRSTRSLERPLPLSQSQPQSPARSRSRTRPLPPPHSPTHHIPPLIPPTADGDPIPVNSPPPPPARYPTSPKVVVRTGAGRAANGLRGPPKGGLPGQNN